MVVPRRVFRTGLAGEAGAAAVVVGRGAAGESVGVVSLTRARPAAGGFGPVSESEPRELSVAVLCGGEVTSHGAALPAADGFRIAGGKSEVPTLRIDCFRASATAAADDVSCDLARRESEPRAGEDAAEPVGVDAVPPPPDVEAGVVNDVRTVGFRPVTDGGVAVACGCGEAVKDERPVTIAGFAAVGEAVEWFSNIVSCTSQHHRNPITSSQRKRKESGMRRSDLLYP